jgi:hypothetical protein
LAEGVKDIAEDPDDDKENLIQIHYPDSELLLSEPETIQHWFELPFLRDLLHLRFLRALGHILPSLLQSLHQTG